MRERERDERERERSGFESTWAISFTPLCRCFSEETVIIVGPFTLESMPVEVIYCCYYCYCCRIVWFICINFMHAPRVHFVLSKQK